jgi:ubiquitin carboxyl-terminal hydrolase 36/42
LVLTVHFKRFSPMGRKISHHVNFEEHLSLKPFMSEDQHGPSYSLYGIICHAGGGPNSGHYYAFVKAKDGQWWEMNDEMRSRVGSAPTNKKTAYMLFYIRNKGQGLDIAVKAPPLDQTSSAPQRNGLAAGMKKRKERDSEAGGPEDMGMKVSKPFGPLERPSTPVVPDAVTPDAKRPVNGIDPQAALIKSKIEAASAEQARRALAIIGNYNSDSDAEGKVQEKGEDLGSPTKESDRPSSPAHGPPMSSSPAIPTSSFYGTSNASKKRKSPDTTADRDHLQSNTRTRPNELTNRGTVGYRNPYNITPAPAKTYLQKKSFNRKPRGI